MKARRQAKQHQMHLNGLTLDERKIGAIVATGGGLWEVVDINETTKVVKLERRTARRLRKGADNISPNCKPVEANAVIRDRIS